jgi:hypothetical protein
MKALVALVIVCLIVSLLIVALPVNAQEPLNLTIKPDGSIEPSTNLLERNGTTYTFKGDFYGTIWVQTNNIVIDGVGHALEGTGIATGQNSEIGILLGGPDLSHRRCTNVLIQNLRFYNVPRGIYSVGGSNNTFIGNYFDKSSIEIQGNANLMGDLIKYNTLINTYISFDYNPNGTDIITENNFVNSTIYVWLAKAPVVDGNYWSNYLTKYPNAKEIEKSGFYNLFWDTPYNYGESLGNYTDSHPLINPISTSPISTPTSTSSPISTSTLLPSPSQTIEPSPSIPEFPTWIFVLPLAVTVGVCLLVFFKKRKREVKN